MRTGDITAMDGVLSAGGDIDARDRYGQTALMVAAARGDAAVVAWLVEHGAGLDHTAKYGLSALMLAVIRGHHDVVRVLVAAGADSTLRGRGAPGFADKTAYDLAIDRGDDAIVALLRGTVVAPTVDRPKPA